MNDQNFQKVISEWMVSEIYTRLNEGKSGVEYKSAADKAQ